MREYTARVGMMRHLIAAGLLLLGACAALGQSVTGFVAPGNVAPAPLPIPNIGPTGGAYQSPAVLAITAETASSIWYTIDGSAPGCGVGKQYVAPFGVFRNATVKSVACDVHNAPGPVVSYAYTFNTVLSCYWWKTLRSLESTGSTNLPASLCTDAGVCRPQTQHRCWDQNALFNDPANGSSGSPRFDIIGLATFPVSDPDPAYPYYPVTMAYAQPQVSFLTGPSQIAGVKKLALMWGNRCSPTATSTSADCVGNDTKTTRYSLNGNIYDTFFSSRVKSDACTEAQTRAAAGDTTDNIRAPLDATGVAYAINETPLIAAAALLATTDQRAAWAGPVWYPKYSAANAGNTHQWIADTCYVPTAPGAPLDGFSAHATGILFDWEVNDKRTGDQTATFFEHLVPILKALQPGWPILMTPDPIDASGVNSGVTPAVGPRLLAALDGVQIFLNPNVNCTNRFTYSPQAEIEHQMSLWENNGPPPDDKSKFMVSYDFTNDENEGQAVREYLLTTNIHYVVVHMIYIRQMTCDVSDARNASVTGVARHMKDLFNLPVP